MALLTETIRLDGITCGRCVARLGHVLADHPGLEAANANLMGELTVTYDDEQTTRAALLEAARRGGFREAPPAAPLSGRAGSPARPSASPTSRDGN